MFFGRDKLFHLAKAFPSPPTKRGVMAWLKEQEVHQLHLKPKRSSSIKPILLRQPGKTFQMDLIDMGDYKDRLWRYILTVIDAFSRKAYALPLTDKTSDKVSEAFQKIYRDNDLNEMRVMQSDNGGEFESVLDGYLQGRNIVHIRGIPRRPQSQGIVERFNGTLKTLIFQNMLATRSKRWADDLQLLLRSYNEIVHSTTGEAPNDVGEENKRDVAESILHKATKSGLTEPTDIAVGDQVRKRIYKGALEKMSTVNWSRKLYKVVRVVKSRKSFIRTKYKIEDEDGTPVRNALPRTDIQLIEVITKPPLPIIAESQEPAKVPRRRLRLKYPSGQTVPTTAAAPTPAPTMTLRQRQPRAEPQPTRTRRPTDVVRADKDQAIAEQTAGVQATKKAYKFQSL